MLSSQQHSIERADMANEPINRLEMPFHSMERAKTEQEQKAELWKIAKKREIMG